MGIEIDFKNNNLKIIENLFKKSNTKNLKIILQNFNKIKYTLDYLEIIKFNKILQNITKNQINEFFLEIIKFEKFTYKKYQTIDYFFISKLDEKKTIIENITKLKSINNEFISHCQYIEKKNKKTLNYIRKRKKYNKYIIYGGFALFVKKTVLKLNKDIDLISFDEKSEYTVIEENIDINKIAIEIFRYDDFFVKNINLNEKLIVKKNKIKTFSDETLINITLNQFRISRKNIILISNLSKNVEKYKNININDLITIKISNFQPIIYPFSTKNKKYLNSFFKENNLYLDLINLNNINCKETSGTILSSNYVLKDFNYAKQIHDLMYNEILNNDYTSKKDIDIRILTIVFFINLYKSKLEYKNKDLENRLYLYKNLKQILILLINDFIKNYKEYRKKRLKIIN